METFHDLVKNRRSIRKYADKPVERAKIESVLQTTLMSPASKRANGWEFIVVNEASILAQMAECREFGSKFVANAPAAIVIAYDSEKSDVWYEDAAIAAIIMQLAAADLGLGSCWVQVHNRQHDDTTSAEEFIRQLLGIPASLRVLNIVTLGYKDEDRKPYDESKLSYDKIHWNKF